MFQYAKINPRKPRNPRKILPLRSNLVLINKNKNRKFIKLRLIWCVVLSFLHIKCQFLFFVNLSEV